MKNSQVSRHTAESVLKVLMDPADLKVLPFLRVVMLSGLPGSGKSTVAQLLTTGFGFERFSTDQIRTEEMFVGQSHRMGSQHERVMASRYVVYEELARRVRRSLVAGKRVVVDGTNLDDKRLTVLGAVLSVVPVEQVAFLLLRPPEWIMRKRFENVSVEQKNEWWSVYKFWRKYVKDGQASFPSEKVFPRIRVMKVKRYALRTFEWVTQIKGILWDLDGTFYKSSLQHKRDFDDPCISAFARKLKLSREEGEKKFWETYKRLKSKTRTLDSVGIDGRKFISEVAAELPYEKYYKKDKKLRRAIENLGYVKHFVFTNAGKRETEIKLKVLGLDDGLFEKVLVSYEAPHLKPDPRAFLWAARQCGLKPEQMLAVGDREGTDIIPAKKAGFRTCYVWGVSREADVSVPTVYEVAELFGVEV